MSASSQALFYGLALAAFVVAAIIAGMQRSIIFVLVAGGLAAAVAVPFWVQFQAA